ncbi:hypothetical protein OG264_03630 [Streptomyces xanthophaeus]|uniref:hypothetical protein n=1 Tax=Streptomyces xanthophaeus TaxID=67385 RepID=UPI00386C6A43|nr:hypothetical protein OG264_03630 [Streptomyces xanthophaeus]WST64350.1 hypothetical protein OG605_34730 [Streptomyces xanthophaeus]
MTAAVDAMRAHVEDFVRLAGGADPRTREAAVPALGLFLEDADRAVALLGDRLPLAHGTTERLLVVKTMATLALRLPAALATATARLTALAVDAAADPTPGSRPSSTGPAAPRRTSAKTSYRRRSACSGPPEPPRRPTSRTTAPRPRTRP